MTTVTPSLRSDCTASRALGLIGSVTASKPAACRSIATKTTVCPSRCRSSARRDELRHVHAKRFQIRQVADRDRAAFNAPRDSSAR